MVLQYCDYLSTVSGGGYIGSCLSSLLASSKEVSTEHDKFPFSNQHDGENEYPPVKHLRAAKNYLGLFNPELWHMMGISLSGFILMSALPLAVLSVFSFQTLLAFCSVLFLLAILSIFIWNTIKYLSELRFGHVDELLLEHNKRIAWVVLVIDFMIFIAFTSNQQFDDPVVNTPFILLLLSCTILTILITRTPTKRTGKNL
jgi:hypothetical protein